jgi:hypothetical protein
LAALELLALAELELAHSQSLVKQELQIDHQRLTLIPHRLLQLDLLLQQSSVVLRLQEMEFQYRLYL